MNKQRNKKVVKKRKIKKKAIFGSIGLILIIFLVIFSLYQIKITNIYIIGNDILSDQKIMKIAKIDNYPKSLENPSITIKKRLEKNDYIKKVKVEKKGLLNEVYITIEENKPLFYYQIKDKVILSNGKQVDDKFDIPIVSNEIDKDIYDKFLKCMQGVDEDVFVKISEIKYDPNEIDKERFYLTMNDGNYVYLTLYKFDAINNYIDIVKTFNGAKGTLYLDSGEYFELFDNNSDKSSDNKEST